MRNLFHPGPVSAFIFAAAIAAACSHHKSPTVLPQRSKTVVVQYDDFGPQITSYKYIGMGWYQWDSQGGDDPNDIVDIRVVVYRNITLNEVEKLYPVIKQKQDYRYLEHKAALELLGKYDDPSWDELPSTRAARDRALQTKQKILQELGT